MKYIQHTQSTGKVKLDAKDKMLLHWLSVNARLPCTQLARKVKLSHDAVRYRIAQLEKVGVIQGYRTLVNATALGFDAYHILLSLRQPSKDAEQRMVEAFKANPNVRAVIRFSGGFDYKLATVARNVQELDAICNEVLAACGTLLQQHELLPIVRTITTRAFPRSFLDVKEEKKRPLQESAEPDETDFRILSVLADDARQPIYRIAERAHISAETATYRIKHMLANGVILEFRPVINFAVLDYAVYCLLVTIQNMTVEKEQKLRQILHDDPHTIWAVKTVGRYNLMLYACVRHPEEFHTTVDALRLHFPGDISTYQALLAYEQYKYTYFSEAMWKAK